MTKGIAAARDASRPRRRQAERSAESRARILEAAVACIAERGAAETTTQRIARRAGLTWGAIQHHFGDKNAILLTVVEQALDGMVAHLREIAETQGGLPERVHALISGLWPHYSGPLYRAGVEILLSARGDEAIRDRADRIRRRTLRAVDRAWHRLFDDFEIPLERHGVAQRIALAMLSGFALEVTMREKEADFSVELWALERTLERVLRGEDV